jgi:hypothetical protein
VSRLYTCLLYLSVMFVTDARKRVRAHLTSVASAVRERGSGTVGTSGLSRRRRVPQEKNVTGSHRVLVKNSNGRGMGGVGRCLGGH